MFGGGTVAAGIVTFSPGSGIFFLGTAATLLVAGRRKITQHA